MWAGDNVCSCSARSGKGYGYLQWANRSSPRMLKVMFLLFGHTHLCLNVNSGGWSGGLKGDFVRSTLLCNDLDMWDVKPVITRC